MSNKRDELFNELREIIENLDAGEINIRVHKGMPVKIRFVSLDEVILGGERALNKEPKLRLFELRKWW